MLAQIREQIAAVIVELPTGEDGLGSGTISASSAGTTMPPPGLTADDGTGGSHTAEGFNVRLDAGTLDTHRLVGDDAVTSHVDGTIPLATAERYDVCSASGTD